ncbi:MAG TPA: endonuclease Q family protein [Candidatus Methylomirabilis sp.]|nr:endonuclease Q family protein [Candidatus Methylomirabilis sp.]
MRIITDLHLHSKYSRACSKELTLPNIAKACERKGIQMVGTSDFTHPAWRAHIGEALIEAGEGTFRLADDSSATSFILATELSSIYKRNDKTRRVHNLVLFPDLSSVDRFIAALEVRGANLKSDGRPILGIDSEDLLKMVLDASTNGLLIPAHAWTPWFSVFGSQSGFDALGECFGEMTKHIHAIETGLSSDPAMNRRLSALDDVLLVSNSDAHSPDKLGREANVFEMERPSYVELRRILVERDTSKFIETIEFFPEEGKYHADGHRACRYWCLPEETKKRKGVCPKCGKPLTVGVLSRVAELADRAPDPSVAKARGPSVPPRFAPGHSGQAQIRAAVPYRSIVPLAELVGAVLDVGASSKKVAKIVADLVTDGRTEFGVLLDDPEAVLSSAAPPNVVAAILAMRRGEVTVRPGYDGEYGQIQLNVGKK